MQNDPGADWQRLTRLYAEKSDEELLELADDFGNLTEVAQQVLRDEMKQRKIEEPEERFREQPPIFGRWNQESNPAQNQGTATAEEQIDDPGEPHEYTWKTELCTCESSKQAWQVYETLRRASIESWPQRPGASFGTRSVGSLEIRILVAADQLEEARAILSRPIPQEIMNESNMPVEDFVVPRCPKCGTADPLLESVDSSNHWLCENCGAQWTDAQPPAAPE